jgi:hypothetical protein
MFINALGGESTMDQIPLTTLLALYSFLKSVRIPYSTLYQKQTQ